VRNFYDWSEQKMEWTTLPKVELHLHLDCSLSYEVVWQIDPSISREQYRKDFVAPDKCSDLAEYLQCAPSSYPLMQTHEHLQLVTLDLFKQLQADNVIYAEIRFAALQILLKSIHDSLMFGSWFNERA
jgi:adenosine deaminase